MIRILRIAVALTMLLGAAPSTLWAESAVPDPGAFFSQTPGLFDPNASGTKLAGTLTIAYEFTAGCTSVIIDNMFVVITLQAGNSLKPFNTDFRLTHTSPFCFDDQAQQVSYIVALVDTQVMPFFFGAPIRSCAETTGARPCWQVKTVTNFLSSGTGAVSTGITLAVH